jgi:hypothetical protein
MNEQIEKQLEREYLRLSRLYYEEYGYHPSRFLQMMKEYGPVQTTIKLVMDPVLHEGLTKLWELGRLDISVEATILQEPYCNLFSDDVLNKAKEKLEKLGYLNE